jgi:hypothetical protein
MNEAVNGMDFDIFDTSTKANEGVEIAINRADGEPSGLFITVKGMDSEEYRHEQDVQARRRMKKIAQKGRAATDAIADDTRENSLDLVVTCSASWRHESGAPMPFDIGKDKAKARAFYEKYPLVWDQVQVAIADRVNFTKASAK